MGHCLARWLTRALSHLARDARRGVATGLRTRAGECLRGFRPRHRPGVGSVTPACTCATLACCVGRAAAHLHLVRAAWCVAAGHGSRHYCDAPQDRWWPPPHRFLPSASAALDGHPNAGRPFFFAGIAKGADVATWKQAARAEMAAGSRAEYGIALLDLVKCFDTVPHDWLVRQAISQGYNLCLLRLSLAVYRLLRAVRVGLCYSKTMVATCGITAAAVMATIELRVLFIQFLDYAAAISPLTYLTVYVDDMSIETAGPEGVVSSALIPVLRYIASCATSLRMELSPTKNFCCASRTRIGREIVKALPQLMIRLSRRVTSLGAPLAAGRRRSSLVASKRLRAFRMRVTRFRRLRKVGIDTARLIRIGGGAALTYGQHVCGVSNSLLLRQRRAVAACTVLSRGG